MSWANGGHKFWALGCAATWRCVAVAVTEG